MPIGASFLKRTVILCAAFFPVSAFAADKPPQHFKPSGPWAMEYADEGCRLIRNFSDGKMELTFALERYALEPMLRLGLTGKGLVAARNASEIQFRWGDETPRKSNLLFSTLTDGRSAYLFPSLALNEPEHQPPPPKPWPYVSPPGKPLPELLKAEKETAGRTTAITITKGFPAPLQFDVGKMAAPIEAMQKCAEDLVSGWGVDIGRLTTQSRPATPANDPRRWVTPDDYPASAVRASIGGMVRARLIIGTDGKIEKCMVDMAVRGPFEQVVCNNIVIRAKFAPALDAEGKAFRTYVAQTWLFSMP